MPWEVLPSGESLLRRGGAISCHGSGQQLRKHNIDVRARWIGRSFYRVLIYHNRRSAYRKIRASQFYSSIIASLTGIVHLSPFPTPITMWRPELMGVQICRTLPNSCATPLQSFLPRPASLISYSRPLLTYVDKTDVVLVQVLRPLRQPPLPFINESTIIAK